MQVYLVTLRTLLLGLGCVLAALGSDSMGYGGAGALGCIVAAFVASFGWRKQGWNFNVCYTQKKTVITLSDFLIIVEPS